MSRLRLGAHVSTAGGLALAFPRGSAIGCDALQIFVKSPNQWRAKPIAEEESTAFRAARDGAGGWPVVAHAAYLINLAALDPELLAKSRAGLADELARGLAIGLDGVVVHPGAHVGRGIDAALTAVAESIDALLAGFPAGGPKLLLELTAGQGTVVGHTLEQLAAIRDRSHSAEKVAFCLDTCHAFASGYELSTGAAVEDFLAQVDRVIGFPLVACIHLNDSTGERGSKKDRHANFGKGRIGLEGIRRLLVEPRLAGVPGVLETPLGDDERGHADDLVTLRRLIEDGPAAALAAATVSVPAAAAPAPDAKAKPGKPKSAAKEVKPPAVRKAKAVKPAASAKRKAAKRGVSARTGSSKGRTRAR